jgi:hypothetical protein
MDMATTARFLYTLRVAVRVASHMCVPVVVIRILTEAT